MLGITGEGSIPSTLLIYELLFLILLIFDVLLYRCENKRELIMMIKLVIKKIMCILEVSSVAGRLLA